MNFPRTQLLFIVIWQGETVSIESHKFDSLGSTPSPAIFSHIQQNTLGSEMDNALVLKKLTNVGSNPTQIQCG